MNLHLKKIKISILTLVIIALSCFHAESQTICYSLDTCKVLTLSNNLQIINKKLEVQASQQVKNEAFTKYFPQISAMGAAFYSDKNLVNVNSNNIDMSFSIENQVLNDMIRTLYSVYGPYISDFNINMQMMQKGLLGGVIAMQPIYAGGRIINGNRLANEGIKAATLQLNIAENEALIKTEQMYWQLVSLEEKIKTLSFVTNFLDTIYKDITGATKAGLTLTNDVLKVKLKRNEIKSNYIKVENGIKMVKQALCQHIGIAYSDSVCFIIANDSIIDYDINKADHNLSLNQRSEYQLLDLSVRVESLKQKMILGEVLPQVAMGGAYTFNNLMKNFQANALVFVNVSIPITNWWETSYKLKEQKIKLNIAANTKQEYSDMLKLQMQSVWHELLESKLQLDLANETKTEAAANLKLSKDLYQAGMITISDLLQAQTTFQQSQDNLSDMLIQFKIKKSIYTRLTK